MKERFDFFTLHSRGFARSSGIIVTLWEVSEGRKPLVSGTDWFTRKRGRRKAVDDAMQPLSQCGGTEVDEQPNGTSVLRASA